MILTAQTYLIDVYTELEALYPAAAVTDSTVTIWLALNVDQSGVRLRFDPNSMVPPTMIWWARLPRSGDRLIPPPCERPTPFGLIESCPMDWPEEFSTSQVYRRLMAAGALPFPDRQPLPRGPPPPLPCPDDGWDLWMYRGEAGNGPEIHYCNWNYGWDSETIESVLTELQEVWIFVQCRQGWVADEIVVC